VIQHQQQAQWHFATSTTHEPSAWLIFSLLILYQSTASQMSCDRHTTRHRFYSAQLTIATRARAYGMSAARIAQRGGVNSLPFVSQS
jgi:hypothetical protein